jgi:hypothetical protein
VGRITGFFVSSLLLLVVVLVVGGWLDAEERVMTMGRDGGDGLN